MTEETNDLGASQAIISAYNNLGSQPTIKPGNLIYSSVDKIPGKTEHCGWGSTTRNMFSCLLTLAQILLHGALGLVLYWVMRYRDGFAWREDPRKEFNMHPVLMIGGFVYFSGQALLTYRTFRCWRRIYNKLLHTIFHLMAVPCIVVAFLAVFDSHNLPTPPIPNFYSLHSWMGFVTMGLFGLQFSVGFFTFLILLCCEGSSAAFRAALVPVHGTFGLITFLMAIATCLTGLTEKAIFALGPKYENNREEEAIVIKTLGMVLVALAIIIPCAIRYTPNKTPIVEETIESERL